MPLMRLFPIPEAQLRGEQGAPRQQAVGAGTHGAGDEAAIARPVVGDDCLGETDVVMVGEEDSGVAGAVNVAGSDPAVLVRIPGAAAGVAAAAAACALDGLSAKGSHDSRGVTRGGRKPDGAAAARASSGSVREADQAQLPLSSLDQLLRHPPSPRGADAMPWTARDIQLRRILDAAAAAAVAHLPNDPDSLGCHRK
jgi:hypothetical protein